LIISNLTKNTTVSDKAIKAESYAARLKGLLGRDGLLPGESLIIFNCGMVHAFFMKFTIGLIFADRQMKVLKTAILQPWQVSPQIKDSYYVIELLPEDLEKSRTEAGDQLSF
jgi:uncharacterized membrane protein (UPF0127 family)